MSKILVIKSAITGDSSISNKYVAELVGKIRKSGDQVIVRDLSKNTIETLKGEHLEALKDPNSATSKKFDALIEEIKNSDIIVIGAPMYNLNISGVLKNYLDAITIINKTFRFTNEGTVEGLIKNKKVYVVTTRGGIHKDQGRTFLEDYLSCHLAYMGMTDVDFIFIEGIGMGLDNEQLNRQFLEQLK